MFKWIANFIRGGDDLESTDRRKKLEAKRNYRLEKIEALKEKIYAVAAKRKWLFLIIAGVIVGYLIFKFV